MNSYGKGKTISYEPWPSTGLMEWYLRHLDRLALEVLDHE